MRKKLKASGTMGGDLFRLLGLSLFLASQLPTATSAGPLVASDADKLFNLDIEAEQLGIDISRFALMIDGPSINGGHSLKASCILSLNDEWERRPMFSDTVRLILLDARMTDGYDELAVRNAVYDNIKTKLLMIQQEKPSYEFMATNCKADQPYQYKIGSVTAERNKIYSELLHLQTVLEGK